MAADDMSRPGIRYDASIDEILVERRKANRNPNIGSVDHVVLKNGPRSRKWAMLYQILDPRTGETHHYSLKLEAARGTKSRGWALEAERSISLDSDGDDEIERLMLFLWGVLKEGLPGEGRWSVLNARATSQIRYFRRLFKQAAPAQKLDSVKVILDELAGSQVDAETVAEALSDGEGDTLRELGAASRMVQCKRALAELEGLVEQGASEAEFQRLLEANAWMFGTEYAVLLNRRKWVRDDQQDFMLRRTADDYLEIVEIKTPLGGKSLFLPDPSRHSMYARAELSQAVGQAIRYIEQVEGQRASIRLEDEEDPLKVQARVILGRDGDAQQRKALRTFNSHLHRVEVLTFDHLVRIARRAISMFSRGDPPEAGEVFRADDDDDIPF